MRSTLTGPSISISRSALSVLQASRITKLQSNCPKACLVKDFRSTFILTASIKLKGRQGSSEPFGSASSQYRERPAFSGFLTGRNGETWISGRESGGTTFRSLFTWRCYSMLTLDDFDLLNQLRSYKGYDIIVCFMTSKGGITTRKGTLEIVNRWHIRIQTSTKSGFRFKIPTESIQSVKPLDPLHSPQRESQINVKRVV